MNQSNFLFITIVTVYKFVYENVKKLKTDFLSLIWNQFAVWLNIYIRAWDNQRLLSSGGAKNVALGETIRGYKKKKYRAKNIRLIGNLCGLKQNNFYFAILYFVHQYIVWKSMPKKVTSKNFWILVTWTMYVLDIYPQLRWYVFRKYMSSI